jgi:hypothetical protein
MTNFPKEPGISDVSDRVRRSTAAPLNEEIDRRTDAGIKAYSGSSRDEIIRRIRELDREWDIERILEVNASTLALTGLVLGMTVNRKWLAVPAVVLSFLLQHGIQGWCPPLPILRRLGIRTRGEIDREKYQLIALLDYAPREPVPAGELWSRSGQ